MVFGFGKNKTKSTNKNKKQLNRDLEGIMKELKKERIIECQNLGMTVNKMGQDLSYLDKKIKSIYNEAIKEIKVTRSHEDAYIHLRDSYASSDIDRKIIEKIFSDN